ncbi:penicillin-binding protein, 1A family [Pseudooceanicola nitratireducens]|jgi:1A family penicillin-binding protein|uniref:peptidoglycan glycosyltransferase n=1 Tax=Pseudooceanicola nitratireducens TaxID=517719 RepID=A0A1I1I665_9RHOB|nr:PBP1A family penicillin-binding protein [Pseudooceanicola nitratireducens]SEJ19433.1 penicillin-binding protein, 1A family [Pseudooceanicola nitratireducens]SFC31616.1 penicillin-binding protein, 1A family [Pseudooceanicola nitratireducens]
MSDSGRRKPPLVADRRFAGGKGKGPAKGKSRTGGGRKASSGRGGSKSRRRSPAPRRPRGPLGLLTAFIRWIFRLVFGMAWRLSLVIVLIIALAVAYSASTMPPLEAQLDGRARGSVTMLDREGQVFAWRGDQFGGVVTAETVSPHLKNAIVATEDKRFYSHFGISPRGIASAIRINLREGRGPLSGHGGSTITQQTAKLLCLGDPYDPDLWDNETAYESDCRQTTLWRKIREAIYAMGLETAYSKDEILTIYMNRAFLGAGARGFEAASQRYFGKSAADVTPAEAAMLAGLLVAPTRYAPTADLARSQNRAGVIVRLMEEQDYLTAAQADAAIANPAELSEAAEAKAGGYFADWVMSSGPEYLTRKTTEDVVIRTTLDQRLQKAAEDGMKAIFENKVKEGSKAQAAVVVMSADGAVRAMVGGRRTKVSGAFNRATQALRQTGSAFKPFVYATALELGYHWYDTVEDTPLTINIPGSGPWSPDNYDRKFRGTVTMAQALQGSLNIPAVRIAESVGLENVRKIAADFGIQSDLAQGPALALGASESTLIEMTGAYAGILNGGSSVTPYGLVELRLQGQSEPLMDATGGIGERVIREAAARELIWMMNNVVTQGTGGRAALPNHQAAGKTGTTSAARDAWFIGFTADYVAGVWMGYDDNTPLTGVTGSGLPAEIWHEVMVRVHEGVEPRPLPMARPERPADAPGFTNGNQGQQPQRQDPIERLLRNLFGIRN